MYKKRVSCFLGLLFVSQGVRAVQQGTLTITNSSGADSVLRLVTQIDAGSIGDVQFKDEGKKIIMPSEDPSQWVAFSPGQRLIIDTPIRISTALGGQGSIWGSLVKLYILNRQTMRANLFELSKVAEYVVAKDVESGLILIGKEGTIYAQ